MDELDLYNEKIMGLANKISKDGAINLALTFRNSITSPLCGSRVDCGYNLEEEKIADLQMIARACALGSSSAALASEIFIGHTKQEITMAHDQLKLMLREKGAPPSGDFAMFEIFLPCIAHRARHAAILLPFLSVIEAK